MTRDAFDDLASQPELRDLQSDTPFSDAACWVCVVAAAEMLLGGLGALIFWDWKIIAGTVIVLLATLLIGGAILARKAR